MGKHPSIKALVDGITAAVVGALAGSVIVICNKNYQRDSNSFNCISNNYYFIKNKESKRTTHYISCSNFRSYFKIVVLNPCL